MQPIINEDVAINCDDKYDYTTKDDRNKNNVVESDHYSDTSKKVVRGLAYFMLSDEDKKKVWAESLAWAQHCLEKGLL